MTNSSPFRGREGRLHFLWYAGDDCWRGRPAGCCLLCKARLVWKVIRG